jgi:hypothetical protein
MAEGNQTERETISLKELIEAGRIKGTFNGSISDTLEDLSVIGDSYRFAPTNVSFKIWERTLYPSVPLERVVFEKEGNYIIRPGYIDIIHHNSSGYDISYGIHGAPRESPKKRKVTIDLEKGEDSE